jgi:hypothetical protein
MKVRPIFAWYDLWIGAFWDAGKRRLYILPLPCIGIVIEFGPAAIYPPENPVPLPCDHSWRRYPTFGRWRCMACGAEGNLPFAARGGKHG